MISSPSVKKPEKGAIERKLADDELVLSERLRAFFKTEPRLSNLGFFLCPEV